MRTLVAAVAVLGREAASPRPPAACRDAVVSVRVIVGVAGSVVPPVQTVARSVVVPVPVVCSRTFSVVPGVYVRPGTRTSPPGNASAAPSASRDIVSPTVPSASRRTRMRYSWLTASRRPVTYTDVPDPVGAEDAENETSTFELVDETPCRYALSTLPAASRRSTPAPGVTETRVEPLTVVQAPPVSAVPNPAATVRPKASAASTCGPA